MTQPAKPSDGRLIAMFAVGIAMLVTAMGTLGAAAGFALWMFRLTSGG